jgi:hypothetical protein
MYDPKFEKGVRQKMEGLEFIPSESVWANIQKAVAGRRRRRGGFYFWRLALPGMLLTGIVAVGYFTARPVRTPSTAAAPVASTANHSPSTANHPASTANHPASTANHPAFTADHAGYKDRAVANNHNAGDRNTAANRSSAGDDRFADADQRPIATAPNGIASAPNGNTAVSAGNASAAIAPYLYRPALVGQGSAAAIKAGNLSAKKNIVALGSLEKTKRPWEAGFVAGGGISRLNRLNLSSAAQDQALSANLYNIASTTASPSKHYVSDIRPDASFLAGIYLQKPLSSRWTVNLGMNLHYYSTRITIGDPVNTYVPASASLITPTALPAAQTSTSFIAGDRQIFTNHYYFLELPVNIQYKLNKSHLLPFFFEGGFSLSRLMGSDALSYNPHSGVYYKDPGVLEKTQFNVSSALLVGLPFHGIRIQAGPQVEYGLTPLINNHDQGDQHFFYTGFRVVIIPGRK